MKNLIFILIISVLLTGCKELGLEPEKGEDGTTTTIYVTADATTDTEEIDTTTDTEETKEEANETETVIVSNPSGYAEAASCLGFGEVDMFELDNDSNQIAYYRGETSADNTGHYTIPAVITSEYVLYGADLDCRRETTTGTVNIKLRSWTLAASTVNLNIPGTIKTFVAQAHYRDSNHSNYGDKAESLATAQAEVLAFFNMPDTGVNFENTSIQGDSISDAVTALISATIDLNNSGPEQGDFMKEIAEGILNDDTTLKTSVNLITARLPIKGIIDNLDSLFVELGINATSPPIWFDSPDYYGDILGRTPIEQGSKNKVFSSSGGTGLSTYSLFQYPVNFTGIETSKYIELNINDGDLSIWTKGGLFNGYEIRGTKIINLVKLNEVLLPESLAANYFLGDSHGLVSGTDYILIQSKSTPSDQATLITGDSVSFSQNSASDDNGSTWLPANVTARFTTSIKWILWN